MRSTSSASWTGSGQHFVCSILDEEVDSRIVLHSEDSEDSTSILLDLSSRRLLELVLDVVEETTSLDQGLLDQSGVVLIVRPKMSFSVLVDEDSNFDIGTLLCKDLDEILVTNSLLPFLLEVVPIVRSEDVSTGSQIGGLTKQGKPISFRISSETPIFSSRSFERNLSRTREEARIPHPMIGMLRRSVSPMMLPFSPQGPMRVE